MKTTDIKVGYLTEDQADELIKYTAEDAREFVRLAVKDFKPVFLMNLRILDLIHMYPLWNCWGGQVNGYF